MPSLIPSIRNSRNDRAKLPQNGMSTAQLNIQAKGSEEAYILNGRFPAEIVKAELFGD